MGWSFGLITQRYYIVYLTSDGYVDQNNPEHKKFGSPKFADLLTSIAKLPLEQQKQELEQALDDFMENEAQRDDIVVIGIKIKIN